MNFPELVVKQLPSGRWKACLWGQREGHLMDWSGSGDVIATVPGQPLRGFAEKQAAAEAGVRLVLAAGGAEKLGSSLNGKSLSNKLVWEVVYLG